MTVHSVFPGKVHRRTREEWHRDLVTELRPRFAAVDAPIPSNLRISTGFPAGRVRFGAVLAECYAPSVSSGGVIEIFVTPMLDDTRRVIDVVIHELIHAAVGNAEGHKGRFATVARALGLRPPMTETTAGPELRESLEGIIRRIGPYPHDRMRAAGDLPDAPDGPMPPGRRPDPKGRAHPPQGTRMIRCACASCGYVCRTTRKWIDAAGAPLCPCNRAPMGFTLPPPPQPKGDDDDQGDDQAKDDGEE